MDEAIIEVNELEKKITGFQNIPKGNVEVAYVFFQSKDNKKFVITTEKKKIMAAELRIGKYDRIMTIRRGEYNASFQEKVYCEEEGHWFQLFLNVNYYIKEPEYVFQNQVYQLKPLLAKSFSEAAIRVKGEYGYREVAKLEDKLCEEVEKGFAALKFMTISYKMDIKTDETAKIIIERERKHEILENEADLIAIENKVQLENSYELEHITLEKEKETVRLTSEAKNIAVRNLGDLIQYYGTSAGDYLSYADGELKGAALTEKLEKRQKESKEDNFRRFMELYEKGVITDAGVETMLSQFVSDGKDMTELDRIDLQNETKTIADKTEEEKADTNTFQWNDSDGGDGTVE